MEKHELSRTSGRRSGQATEFGFHSTALDVVRNVDLTGFQVVLTGASSGIGIETARALAKAGAHLVLGVRNVTKAQIALQDIAVAHGNSVSVEWLDLSDLHSVIEFADKVTGPIDILIANGGVSKTPESHLANGLDVRFATNHLGHFLLAHRLKRQLAQRGARIVVVSSAGHKGMPVRMDDLQWQARPHIDGAAYAESKSANILFAQEATRRWGEQQIFANAVLPGSSLTGLQRYHSEALKRQIGFINVDGSINDRVKSAEQAAATSVWAATATELAGKGGLVLEDCAEAVPVGPNTHPWAGFDASVADPETARILWDYSLELVCHLAGQRY